MWLKSLLLIVPVLLADINPRKKENILVMGDSEAGSVYFALNGAKKADETLAQTAARLAGQTYANETLSFEFKGGTPIDYWSRDGHGQTAILSHPDAGTIVIFLGTNDFWKKDVPDVEPLLREVRAAGMKCVWAGNTAVQDKKWSINSKLKRAVEKDCTYIDSESIELGDKVHPTFKGVVQWLKQVWSAK